MSRRLHIIYLRVLGSSVRVALAVMRCIKMRVPKRLRNQIDTGVRVVRPYSALAQPNAPHLCLIN